MEKKRDLAKQEMPKEKQDPLIMFLSLTERQQRNRWNLQQSFLPRNPHKAQRISLPPCAKWKWHALPCTLSLGPL